MRMALSRAVRSYLNEHQINQHQLAARSGVSQATISRAQKGNWKRRSDTILRLADYLGVAGTVDPKKSEKLMEALGQVWDGTPQSEEAIVKILFSIQALRSIRS